ncbi:Uncharacterized protein OBRU01_11665 [Operophtera brumata]|uniref:Uncharacterized protein n=1 Tax=Operophtera brumata TaxID=104452 RepID=A0A0L7L498_OPEBR|nr:Uncharacterized protein OBRU01_11665 [Operophtera brumata]
MYDREAAEGSLSALVGRDPDYQLLAVKGLLGRAKRPPSESVPGFGFKDRETAEGSLRAPVGRDPDYQLLVVKGLLGRAKRVLTCTKDETKLSNIKEAMGILEGFVDEFEDKHMSRQNCPYLSVGLVRTASQLAGDTATEQPELVPVCVRRGARRVQAPAQHEPTKEHLEFLLWAYSPEAARVKKLLKETKEDFD